MKLSELRKSQLLSQRQLAEKIGVSQQAVSKYERGFVPSPKVAQRIAQVLDFDWTRFFDNEVK